MPFFRKNQKTTALNSKRKQNSQTSNSYLAKLFDPNQILRVLLFFAFSFFIVLICFVGQFPSGFQVLPNQIAKIRIVADLPFSYISKIQTKYHEDLLRKQIAPVYTLDEQSISTFLNSISEFTRKLDEAEPIFKAASKEDADKLTQTISTDYENRTNQFVSPEDIALLLSKTDAESRKKIFNEGSILLKDITREGIFKPMEPESETSQNVASPYFFSIQIEGRDAKTTVLSEKDALRTLNLNLSAMNIDWPLSRVVFRILKTGLKPNLVYDPLMSSKKIEKAIAMMPLVIIEVPAGQTIIEPGSVVGPEQIERLTAYRDFLNLTENLEFGFDATIRERTILTLVILFAAILYMRIALPDILKSNKKIALAALAIIIHLTIVRLIFELGDTDLFGKTPYALSVIPFAVPIALAPMIIAIMIGIPLATVVAALTSTFYALMLGSLTSFFLISLVSSLIGIYFCRNIRFRSNVVRAGAISGVCVALASFFVGSFNDTPLNTLLLQVVFSLAAGVFTGILIIGIIPLLESLFKFTTNITLLELTDFNHPLLRRLQIEAPGTYHHSLLVANLAERAASEIGANPLVCRITALYHDIGKIIKPEYFAENQSDSVNPHMDRNPSMSALIIKSHVKEGVALAKEYKLPAVITDVIEQHHGTTMIKYFFDKALKQTQQTHLPFSNDALPAEFLDDSEVDESRFRYDGPIANFSESAIVSLADSIEAASRSLKKVTPANVNDLINSIFKEKLEEHQLDEAPITLQEINLLKRSFAFTLLNMLHSRIEYPDKESTTKSNNFDEISRRTD